MNRKKRSLSLFVCSFCFTSFCFTCFTRQNKLIAEHVECHVWSLKQAEEVVGGGDDTSFFFFVCLFFRFYKNYFIIIIFLFIFFFFMKIIFIFSCSGMLRNVPECSAVPCFIDALSCCGAFEERSCLSGPPLKLIIMRKA